MFIYINIYIYIYIYIYSREGIPSRLSGGFEVTMSIEGQIMGWDVEIGVGLAGCIGYMQCSI